jgi:hypothetical protein
MSEDTNKAIEEFLAKGGKIQYGAFRESGRVEGAEPTNPWGARKKAGRPAAEDKPVTDEDEDE